MGDQADHALWPLLLDQEERPIERVEAGPAHAWRVADVMEPGGSGDIGAVTRGNALSECARMPRRARGVLLEVGILPEDVGCESASARDYSCVLTCHEGQCAGGIRPMRAIWTLP